MNILLLTPKLNDYHVDIEENLKSKGHYVKWYCSNQVGNNLDKLLNRIDKNYLINKFDKYIESIIADNKESEFDKVLLIFGGNNFRKKHVCALRSAFKHAEFIYYNWDSIANYPEIKNFYKEFDRYYSFDQDDCNKYGFSFLPLFYCNKYENVEPIYDLFTIMSYNANKERGYKSIKKVLPDNLREVEYLYTPNRIKIMIDEILKKSYLTSISFNKLHFEPMQRNEVYKMIQKSRVVLDTPRENQNGLTMRTFETLNQQRKLITTNTNIKKYEFYCEDNVYVVDSDSKKIPLDFFIKPFNSKYKLDKKYSLDSFLDKIIL